MERLGKYYHHWNNLSRFERVVFLKAALTLLAVKAGLTVFPFSTFRKVFHWFSKTNAVQELPQQQIDTTVWAVRSAAGHLPLELLCLPQALAIKYLLKNVPAIVLEIGVDITPNKTFEAHAWVEKSGTIIIGDWPETISYHRLWIWN